MKRSHEAQAVEMIPIEHITVINPRVRNKKIFKEIIANIAEIGLKKPITVARRDGPDGPRYDLICGQGRVEAYQALGQREIPALVIDADAEDCLLRSLVENLARRQHRPIDLLHDIQGLKKRGYDDTAIGKKTGLPIEYVKGVIPSPADYVLCCWRGHQWKRVLSRMMSHWCVRARQRCPTA